MRITFKDVLSRKEWLHTELLNSLPSDVVVKASDDQFYDVKLLVNGVEVEPRTFNSIVDNIEKYIDEQAKSLVRKKLEEADLKVQKLLEILQRVNENIIDEFCLDRNDIEI